MLRIAQAESYRILARLTTGELSPIPKTLRIFGEPTTGLHFDDINKLLTAFRALIEAGGSLLVIEHNLDVTKTADYVIDLGPDGGDAGGQVVVTGTPEHHAREKFIHRKTLESASREIKGTLELKISLGDRAACYSC